MIPFKETPWHTGTVYKNAFLLSVADAASKGASGLIVLLIARYLGPALYGKFAIASSVCGLFMMITGIGFEQEFTRRGGQNKENIPEGLMLNLTAVAITSFFAYSSLITFFMAGVYPKEIAILGIVLGLAMVSTRFQLPFRHLCLLINRSNINAYIQTFATFLLVIMTLFIVYNDGNLLEVAFSQLGVGVGVLLMWWLWTPKDYFAFVPAYYDLTGFFKASIPFALSNIIWIVYFNFDTVMLSLFSTESEVGMYAGVYRIIGINYIIGYAVANTFTPILFERFVRDRHEFAVAATRLVITMAAIGLPLAALLFAYSDFIIPAIIGEEYKGGIIIAQLLSIAIIFRLLNFGLCEILTTANMQGTRVIFEGMLLLVNIFFNYMLIKEYGGRGAAVATIAAEVSLTVLAFVTCYRKGLLS